ncbi:DMT family transporter [Candidatus Saccharibacteria bacterium]|nr:DMT family transporter [Candidatus Saccharibacteria bacterium]
MSWLLLTFISVISRAIYGVMTKVLSNRVKVTSYTQSFILLMGGGLIALLIAPLIGGYEVGFTNVNITAVVLVVLASALGNILYFIAINSLTSSTAQITFSSILVFNTTLSVAFLDLTLSPLNILGVMLLMIAITSVVTGKIKLSFKGVSLMLLSALCFAIMQLASTVVSKEVSALSYLIISYFGVAVVVFIAKARLIVREMRDAKDKVNLYGVPFITALPSVGNFLFAYYAYRLAPEPTKVAILLTSQVVLTVIISYFFLGERDHVLRKVFASVLVVLSALLIRI